MRAREASHLVELAAESDTQPGDLHGECAGVEQLGDQRTPFGELGWSDHRAQGCAGVADGPASTPVAGIVGAHRGAGEVDLESLSGSIRRTSRSSTSSASRSTRSTSSGAARPACRSSRNAVICCSASKRARLKRRSTTRWNRSRNGRNAAATASVAPAVAHAELWPTVAPSRTVVPAYTTASTTVIEPYDDGAADDDVDVVEPIAEDRDPRRHRHRGQRDSGQRAHRRRDVPQHRRRPATRLPRTSTRTRTSAAAGARRRSRAAGAARAARSTPRASRGTAACRPPSTHRSARP